MRGILIMRQWLGIGADGKADRPLVFNTIKRHRLHFVVKAY
jgi:hypothetical protein